MDAPGSSLSQRTVVQERCRGRLPLYLRWLDAKARSFVVKRSCCQRQAAMLPCHCSIKILLNALTFVFLYILSKVNLPVLGPDMAAIPARHKRSWIGMKNDLSSLLDLWTFRELWSVALFAPATHILSLTSPRRFVKLF